MIIETQTTDAFGLEGQPGGGSVTVVDPYDGCQLHCPYCFQLNDADWNRDIYVKVNLPEVLQEQAADRPASDPLYVGSRCDPYMPLEDTYRLTQKCLEVMGAGQYPVFITTKADNGLVLRDLELLRRLGSCLTVLMGLAHVAQAGKGPDNRNIQVANALLDGGITVWAFITPILPYIMDVDAMIQALDPAIPVYLDKLRVFSQGRQDERTEEYIRRAYPQFLGQYRKIIYEGDEEYYQELMRRYRDSPRVTFVFE